MDQQMIYAFIYDQEKLNKSAQLNFLKVKY